MILAVLDYASGTVDIITNVPEMKNDDIESYLIEELNYNNDEISWMTLHKVSDVQFLEPEDFS